MKIVSGLFDSYERAAEAVKALKQAGIPAGDISLVANNAVEADKSLHIADDAEAGTAAGAVIGGAGGLLAGLGALAIPGIGPVVAGGWLVATAIGAVTGAIFGLAAGGIIGALTSAGIPEEEAHVYAEGIRRGGALVTARVPDELVDSAEAILQQAEAVDVDERRAEYVSGGWEGFDPDAPEYSRDRSREPRGGNLLPPFI
jgi:hypothetical protein